MKSVMKILAVLVAAVLLVAAAQADDVPELYGREQLTALLDNVVVDIQPGTAGSGIRASARAAELMKWGMNTEMKAEEITEVVNELIDLIPVDMKPDFEEAMSDIYGAYQRLLEEDREEILTEAGCDPTDYEFGDITDIEAIDTIMSAAGITH